MAPNCIHVIPRRVKLGVPVLVVNTSKWGRMPLWVVFCSGQFVAAPRGPKGAHLVLEETTSNTRRLTKKTAL